MTDLAILQTVLGVTFKQISLLSQALTHSSYANENPGAGVSNERLEFLGDAVLDLIVAENLYRNFPELPEGQMTKIRSYLVKQETLALLAKSLDLGAQLYLGKGEENSGGQDKPANLARALEAVIAAVYLDQGLKVTETVVLRLIEPEFQVAISEDIVTDYKSRLQEYLQAQSQSAPNYHLIATEGPDHAKTFVVEARLNDTVLSTGIGRAKKLAEMEAARLALEKLEKATSHT
ncbi:MAG: ribonuclease III [Dehalococcoidales bacterium]|nr:ribonuclease III [Dehalococcoidales bacterium]